MSGACNSGKALIWTRNKKYRGMWRSWKGWKTWEIGEVEKAYGKCRISDACVKSTNCLASKTASPLLCMWWISPPREGWLPHSLLARHPFVFCFCLACLKVLSSCLYVSFLCLYSPYIALIRILQSFKLPDCPSMCGLCIKFYIEGCSVLWQHLVLGFSSVPDNLFWCSYQLLQFQLWDIGLTATTAFEKKIKLLSRCEAQCITFGDFSFPFCSGILLRMNYVHLFQKSFLYIHDLSSWNEMTV